MIVSWRTAAASSRASSERSYFGAKLLSCDCEGLARGGPEDRNSGFPLVHCEPVRRENAVLSAQLHQSGLLAHQRRPIAAIEPIRLR